MTQTREAYLEAAIEKLRPLFRTAGYEIPVVHVSVGFPSQGGLRARIVSSVVLGECWHGKASKDGHAQIFINPIIPDPSRILDVLVHELCHACLGAGHGHGAKFAKLAHAVGLEGKPTATVAGSTLIGYLDWIIDELGEIPHPTLLPGQSLGPLPPGYDPKLPPGSPMPPTGRKQQKCRQRLFECSCGFKIRASRDESHATCTFCGTAYRRKG